MAAEIICVGTEILLGDIVNSNSQYLAREFAKLGITHYFQSVVGDNISRIHSLLEIAVQRGTKILVFTGGLGPTPDDLTTEAIATYFKTPLVERPEIITDITTKFAQRGRVMTPNNRKQALLPEGADILPNPTGTAPGLIWQPIAGLTIFTFPGVPGEMKRMWQDTAVPYLKAQGYGQIVIHSEMMRFRGIGESSLAAKVDHLFELTNPTVAPYASKGEVKLRVAARAESVEAAKKLMDPVVAEIKAIAGLDYFGSDGASLPQVIGDFLRTRQETLAVAESCTGGGLGALITSVSGSSDYFLGGITAYANAVKINLLGVNSADLQNQGAVSETVAQQMALGVKQAIGSDWGIGITGIAGPKSDDSAKPVGLVCVAWADPQNQVFSHTYRYGTDRDRELIRYLSACDALDGLRRYFKSDKP
ncbi:competence/damage-inducible protein A [Picosynechococcus sp. PCC 7003]|uniref:competence/damage-inducible protein A n=1 Tax=Picosynechococcus sp. PCC 7003 TaxID=374981 RepID=UPI000810EF15|nr:competence/damage-inducible protein A [Picosynechococcus sp. PCC 7003]ANV85008.1 competence/damage-inducible protein A [Picosynechococcus sp. PCC 7003]